MSRFRPYNPNPKDRYTIDCVIRAITVLMGFTWDEVYTDLSNKGFIEKDMMSSDELWRAYLKDLGYERFYLPDACPYCYTVTDFCYDNPYGSYLLKVRGHVVGIRDGLYYDTWDSGNEHVLYYYA